MHAECICITKGEWCETQSPAGEPVSFLFHFYCAEKPVWNLQNPSPHTHVNQAQKYLILLSYFLYSLFPFSPLHNDKTNLNFYVIVYSCLKSTTNLSLVKKFRKPDQSCHPCKVQTDTFCLYSFFYYNIITNQIFIFT